MNYAGFQKRFAAAIIDMFCTMGIGVVIAIVLFPIVLLLRIPVPEMSEDMENFSGFILGWIYFAMMECSPKQGTIGKMVMGIKVTDLNGDRISFARATGRHFSKIVSAMTFGIGIIMIAATAKKQGLHDMMAGCYVVDK